MSLVIPIGGWVNLSGEGGGALKFREGEVKKRESPNFRSPEFGMSNSQGGRVGGTPL